MAVFLKSGAKLVLSNLAMALRSDSEGKMISKFFSNDGNGFSMLELVRLKKEK